MHHQFETIHPLADGNGRVGRLLIVLLLVHWGLLPLPLLYLSAYLERHRQQYYDLLLAVSERGDWLSWLVFFLRSVFQTHSLWTRHRPRIKPVSPGTDARLPPGEPRRLDA